MNCNLYGTNTNRCKRCTSRSNEPKVSVATRMQKQRTSQVLFAVLFTIFYCISEFTDGLFQCTHALVAPNDVITRRRRHDDRFTDWQKKASLHQQFDDRLEPYYFEGPVTTNSIQGKYNKNNDGDKLSRRCFLTTAGTTTGFVATALVLPPSDAAASDLLTNRENEVSDIPLARVFEYAKDNPTAITIPLAFTGQELLVAYKVDGSKFKAVLDTGSPFLMIPGSCGSNTRQKSGCYRNQGTPVPNLTPTTEIFDGFEGEVNWRSAPFEFWDVNNNDSIDNYGNATWNSSTLSPEKEILNGDNLAIQKWVIFGVASEEIMGGPGGVFFGMIRDTDARIRPSFLGQTDVRAFCVNLATRPRTLTLSSRNLIATDDTLSQVDYIPMTNILRRRYGDPVSHYTALAQSIYVNGFPLVDTTIDKKSKILVIFDTGVTGMVVSRGLFDEEYMLARKRREKRLFGDVELTFSTALGNLNTLRANNPLATPFDPEQTWKRFPKRREGKKSNTHIIVMGLAFLEGRSLTVDIDEEKLWVE